MTSKEFVIWLDGYLQGNGDNGLTVMQVRDLINKLDKVDLDAETKKEIIIERSERPVNPFKIQESPDNYDDDFPGAPSKIYM